MNRFFLIAFLTFFVLDASVQAQEETTSASNKNAPIEVTAQQNLSWLRNEKKFVARGQARAVQGDVSIAAETLSATYRDETGSDMQLDILEADGGVQIIARDSTATGDHARYDIPSGKAVMTGQNLRMTSPDQTVTAQDTFEYWAHEGKLVARGQAKVVRPKPEGGQDTLSADEITAILGQNAQGKRVLKSMTATGHVVITTPTEVVTGAQGFYNADTNIAELSGGVTIKRGPNMLEGAKAIVNLNTNTSELIGGAGPDGRVRGVFYPGSEKNPGNQTGVE